MGVLRQKGSCSGVTLRLEVRVTVTDRNDDVVTATARVMHRIDAVAGVRVTGHPQQ